MPLIQKSQDSSREPASMQSEETHFSNGRSNKQCSLLRENKNSNQVHDVYVYIYMCMYVRAHDSVFYSTRQQRGENMRKEQAYSRK